MTNNQKITGITIGIALSAAIFASCVTEEGESFDSSEIRLAIDPQLDLPMRANPSQRPEEVLIAFTGVRLHHLEHGWIDVRGTGVIDLMTPRSMPWEMLSAQVPDGMYDEIRLEIRFAAVKVDGRWLDLEVPSGKQTGFKIHTNFCLVEHEYANLNLRWNVEESIHYNEARGYWLTPSIHVASPPSCTDDIRAR
jgi:hypothetical protein